MLELVLVYIVVFCVSLVWIYLLVEDLEDKWRYLDGITQLSLLKHSYVGVFIDKTRLHMNGDAFHIYMKDKTDMSGKMFILLMLSSIGAVYILYMVRKDYISLLPSLKNIDSQPSEL